MTIANELQVTKVISSPISLLSRVQYKKKGFGGPVATLLRATTAIDGRIALMTSRDASNGVTVTRAKIIGVSWSARSFDNRGRSERSKTHSKTKMRGAKWA